MPSHASAIVVGIDDTDNLESRGTGYRARELGRLLVDAGLAELQVITRHQLLVSPLIPYTSHNSSACLRLRAAPAELAQIIAFCRDYLRRESAPGSDAGLCIAPLAYVDAVLREFGARAKRAVLARRDAVAAAAGRRVHLEGLTGDHGGIIGALAAVGLHASAHDGRVLWPRELRECANERRTVAELGSLRGIDRIETVEGSLLDGDSQSVDLGPWPRTVWLQGQAVLLVEKNHDDPECPWRVASKSFLKRY